MTSDIATEPITGTSKRTRVFNVVSDGITGLLVVIIIFALVVGFSIDVLGTPFAVGFGIWAAVCGLVSFPALAVLALSKPRIPLRERSALAASASWFARVVFSAFVFALSIVLGSVAGVVASNASNGGEDLESGLGLAFSVLGTAVLFPTVLAAAAFAFLVMGTRWCWDLGSIVTEGRGGHVRALVERRWTGPLSMSPRLHTLVDLFIEGGFLDVSRVGLVFTLITVALSVACLLSGFSN
ncbi:hypothetical protein FB472_2655 [Rhodoglobus vestalii]|uniref:Uncharacterized protein n=1 Tax=Rhodoglobus vestalii TaxID=193384 RepID=A0A8H2PZ55_9MICO|nr:hypothetical protein [Rhodoglobus vestalii]TQO20994.1 hypothetical protein FB472_2655 [Rhodoglobus vestalii]